MASQLSRCIPAALFALSLPIAAHAAALDGAAKKQTDTAIAHAGMAMAATDVKTAHAHFHHVINCLVGPAGKGFDAKAEDPCKGMGAGAIADAKGDVKAEMHLHSALKEAQKGLKTSTLAAAHADAKEAMTTLQAAGGM
jgi:hypothetical protein